MLARERFMQESVSSKHMADLIKRQDAMLEHINLNDDSVKYSYDQFKKFILEIIETAGEKYKDILRNSFKTLDLNEDGVISFEEWIVSYKVLGIDTKYACASFDHA